MVDIFLWINVVTPLLHTPSIRLKAAGLKGDELAGDQMIRNEISQQRLDLLTRFQSIKCRTSNKLMFVLKVLR